jgi:hypothetical protein
VGPVWHVAPTKRDGDALQVIALTTRATNSDSVSGCNDFAPERDGIALIQAAAMPADHEQNSVIGLLMMDEQGCSCGGGQAGTRCHYSALAGRSEVYAAQV